MKKFIAILLFAMMALSMVACGAADNGEVTYAIVCKDASNPYMLRMISGFETACKAQGVKGIAIAANDAAALEATIKAAMD